MITELYIDNFQSHKETKIIFTQGVNVIVGKSDTGKSAIIRALRWLVFNRPMGEAFRSHWGGDTEVEAIIDGMGAVSRLRSKSENLYIVDRNHEYKALKGEVPSEIQELLKLTDINFQGQIDPHFLLSKTSGEAASLLNQASNLHLIDVGTKNLASGLKNKKISLLATAEQIQMRQEELESYEHVDEYDEELVALEKIQLEVSVLENKRHDLADLIQPIILGQDTVDKKQWVDDAKAEWDRLNDLSQVRVDMASEAGELEQLIYKITAAESIIEQSPDDCMAELEDLVEKHKQADEIYERRTKLERLLFAIQMADEHLTDCLIELDELQTTFEENMPDVCPLCGRSE